MMKASKSTLVSAAALVPVLVAVAASAALASSSGSSSSGTGGLPWEGPLGGLVTMLTGPTARYISIIAIFVAGLGLIFGEDMGGFARKMLMIVIAAAFLIFASSFINVITGASI
jgi:type IV secretion system protein VirB2